MSKLIDRRRLLEGEVILEGLRNTLRAVPASECKRHSMLA